LSCRQENPDLQRLERHQGAAGQNKLKAIEPKKLALSDPNRFFSSARRRRIAGVHHMTPLVLCSQDEC